MPEKCRSRSRAQHAGVASGEDSAPAEEKRSPISSCADTSGGPQRIDLPRFTPACPGRHRHQQRKTPGKHRGRECAGASYPSGSNKEQQYRSSRCRWWGLQPRIVGVDERLVTVRGMSAMVHLGPGLEAAPRRSPPAVTWALRRRAPAALAMTVRARDPTSIFSRPTGGSRGSASSGTRHLRVRSRIRIPVPCSRRTERAVGRHEKADLADRVPAAVRSVRMRCPVYVGGQCWPPTANGARRRLQGLPPGLTLAQASCMPTLAPTSRMQRPEARE